MSKPFNIHDWQAKRRLAENDEYQKRQDRLTPGKNPDEFYKDFDKVKDAADDDEDLTFEPEDEGDVDEIFLDDLDFETLKSFFPNSYQKEKFTRPQTGEPYYEDAISFPNLDDSMMVIGDSSALEDWKDKVSRRFGNVEIVFNDEGKNWFDKVFVADEEFNAARDEFIKGKMSAMQRDQELGRSIDEHTDLLGFKQINIDSIIKEASCRQKSQELADSYSVEELQSRLDQIMRDMEQEAEPEGGPIADMYADEMDAYEGALRIAKGGSDKPLTYGQATGQEPLPDGTYLDKDGNPTTIAPDYDTFMGTNEQSFDAGLANAMGMSDDEFEDQIASRDIEQPFPGDDELTIGHSKASDLIDKLRQDYRDMSDEDLDEFSREMLLHFIDNTAAQAAAKVYFARKGI